MKVIKLSLLYNFDRLVLTSCLRCSRYIDNKIYWEWSVMNFHTNQYLFLPCWSCPCIRRCWLRFINPNTLNVETPCWRHTSWVAPDPDAGNWPGQRSRRSTAQTHRRWRTRFRRGSRWASRWSAVEWPRQYSIASHSLPCLLRSGDTKSWLWCDSVRWCGRGMSLFGRCGGQSGCESYAPEVWKKVNIDVGHYSL